MAGQLRSAGARAALLCAGMLGFCLLTAPASAQVFLEGDFGTVLGSYGEKPSAPPHADPNFSDLSPTGGFGGLGAGYHLRIGNFVVGPRVAVEGGHIAGSNLEADVCAGVLVCDTITDSVTAKWYATAELEAGYVVANHLVFIGGIGWGEGSLSERSVEAFPGGPPPEPPSVTTSARLTASGPVWSAGVDWMLGDRWSVGMRYENLNFENSGSKLLLGGSTRATFRASTLSGNFRWYL